jgi:glyoxylase-like metal-dependent hydrolase (beta-lactamase superfamily II)
MRALLLAIAAALPLSAVAEGLEVQPVTAGVWAIVGEKAQRSSENHGNNATFGLVETAEGAVLIDSGGSWRGAKALHTAVRAVTDAPVRYVLNTGGQDHRWLGNDYWKAQGATIIASQAAVRDQRARRSAQMNRLARFLGEALDGTEPVYADRVFADRYTLTLGETTFEFVHAGPAHTPGDSFVWVPARDTVFTGDIVYVDRILSVRTHSSITDWPEAFRAVEATGAAHVVPGHGHATTMEQARADTYDYLTNLRARIGELIDAGGSLIEAPRVDQSSFAHLELFEALAGRNAQTAFEQMEWE